MEEQSQTEPAQAPEAAAALPRSVTELADGARRFFVVGTAHVSEASVRDVEATIEQIRPDTVCVELCESRHAALVDPSRWRDLDIFTIIREGKSLMLLANLALGAYQRRLGERLGVRPGAELLAGIRCAEAQGATLVLADRDIRTTLRRTWANVPFWRKLSLLGAVFGSFFAGDDIEEEDIEKLKEKGHLSELLEEFARYLPEVRGPLIDERDQYLASRIREAPGERIVAVVGAAHVPGIERWFHRPVDRPVLDEQPPPSRWGQALKWLIPALILAAFTLGASQQGARTLQELVLAWILPNSVVAALATAIGGGHLLSIVAAFVASPITSLNPLIGAGMVVGLVEAWQRKPTVADCEAINDDVQSLRGIYRNRFTRVLVVAALATLGSALGSWIGLTWVVTLLAS